MTLRVLIAEDMPLARQRLRRLLAADSSVTVVAEAGDGETARRLITEMRPDVVFMDIQLPAGDGFDVMAGLDAGRRPAVVFVTAYEEFAVRAFDIQAVDYLLKPVTAERVMRALARVRSRLAGTPHPTPRASTHLARFVIPVAGRSLVVPVAGVQCIVSEGNYVRICAGSRSWLLRESLTAVAARLDPRAFVRIHRSTIVQLSHVASVEPIVNGDQRVTLVNGATFTMSRTHRRAFIDALAGAD
ncbi:MAG: DNA-binding response regulator [Acidimicrobiia bacterium]